jgi:hypothetical protein
MGGFSDATGFVSQASLHRHLSFTCGQALQCKSESVKLWTYILCVRWLHERPSAREEHARLSLAMRFATSNAVERGGRVESGDTNFH